MHILGKVLIWVVVVAALGAVALTSKMIDIRNSWSQKVDGLQQQIEQNQQQLAEDRKKLRDLRAQLSHTLLGWDQYWTEIDSGVLSAAEGTVSANFGSNQGLGRPETPEAPTVYAFQPMGGGEYKYVGAFQATTVRENQTALRAAWRVRSGEADSWQAGSWRFRTQIPLAYRTRFTELENELNRSEELLAVTQRNLAIQEQLVQVSDQHLQFRMKELMGDPDLANQANALPVLAQGLVESIAQEEEMRNALQAEVDRLRRDVKAARNRQQQLTTVNAELANSLPRAKTTTAAK